MITVFTPAFNRGYIIENLYHSLQRQTYKDFEWIVIDDGSSDNTEELFNKWKSDNNFFDIVYKKIENGGKHRAINKGVKFAKGELFFIVDSDDYLTDNALEKIVSIENSIPIEEKSKFCGVCGLKGYSMYEEVGSTFSGKYLDITALQRNRCGITGDKAEVFYTDILIKYPFPEFDGEKFITECVVWNKIGEDGYLLRFFNEIIYICNYLEDGLTAAVEKLYIKNPKGWAYLINQNIKFGLVNNEKKWSSIFKYYKLMSRYITFKQIAENLNFSVISLRFGLYTKGIYYSYHTTLKYYLKNFKHNFFHIPNRLLIKLLGKDKYNSIKNKIRG